MMRDPDPVTLFYMRELERVHAVNALGDVLLLGGFVVVGLAFLLAYLWAARH